MKKESINLKVAVAAVDQMALLQFFPSDAGTRKELLKLISEMCWNDEQVKWLAKRMITLFDQWPGPHELRAVLCSRWPAADGVDAVTKHSRYIEEGFPSERAGAGDHLALNGTPQKALCAATGVSSDEAAQNVADKNKVLVNLKSATKMPKARGADRVAISNRYDRDGNPK